jgi:very-short-patch-repair endonuclease
LNEEPRSGWKSGSETWLGLKPARQNRRDPTPAEAKLWQVLRSFRKQGFPFRRQHAVGTYIVDFYCGRAKLVVEVDGPIHERQVDADAMRTEFLQANRLRVIRFKNHDVLGEIDKVLTVIRSVLDDPSP